MATINELMADATTSHAVDLSQYTQGVIRRMISLLNTLDPKLGESLHGALERLPADSFTVERLEQVLHSVRALNVQAYDAVERELTQVLKEFVEYEASFQYDLYTRVVPGEIQARFLVARVNPEQAYSAAMSRPFQGRLLRDWAKKIEANRMENIRNAVRTGYVSGKTTAQIVQEIRGTRAARYQDGIINRDRRDLTSVVHTAIAHMAETTRERFQSANADLIKATQWVSTLDTKTTPLCIARDGKMYTVETHKPIGHSLPWLGGPGKIHWGCRSASVPVLKSWKELGFEVDELSPSTRASMDGQVAADLTYGEWLQRQSAGRQDQILGPTRARLMRDGELPFDKLFTKTGAYLTLDQLRARDSATFKRAGL